MASFCDLPADVFLIILDFVHNESLGTTLSLALSCKSLYPFAIQKLYRSVLFGFNDRQDALWKFPKHSEAHLIHEFRLEYRSRDLHPFRRRRDRYARIEKLIPRMRNLTTFSLNLKSMAHPAKSIRPEDIDNMLRHLPRSVVNLEIDLANLERRDAITCICRGISRLIPQLHVLRLQAQCVCTKLFKHIGDKTSKHSELRSLVIRSNSHDGDQYFCLCHLKPQQFHTMAAIEKLLFHLYDGGFLPHLEAFALINTSCRLGWSNVWRSVRDINQGPPNGSGTGSRHTQYDSLDPGHKWREERYKSHVAYDASVEGPLAWTELPNGIRLAPSIPDGFHQNMVEVNAKRVGSGLVSSLKSPLRLRQLRVLDSSWEW